MDLFTRLSESSVCYSGPGSVPHNSGPVSDLCAFLCPCLCSLTQHWGLAGPASLRLLCMPSAALQQSVLIASPTTYNLHGLSLYLPQLSVSSLKSTDPLNPL